MKKLLTYFIPSCLFISCNSLTPNQKNMKETENIKAINLNATADGTTLQLKKGDYLKYEADFHPSIDVHSLYKFRDENKVIRLEKKTSKGSGIEAPGGDYSTTYYLFQAFEAGENILTIEESSLGEETKIRIIKIVVD